MDESDHEDFNIILLLTVSKAFVKLMIRDRTDRLVWRAEYILDVNWLTARNVLWLRQKPSCVGFIKILFYRNALGIFPSILERF